jgi:hypothetical protein
MAPVTSQMEREQLLLEEEMVILSIASFVYLEKRRRQNGNIQM